VIVGHELSQGAITSCQSQGSIRLFGVGVRVGFSFGSWMLYTLSFFLHWHFLQYERYSLDWGFGDGRVGGSVLRGPALELAAIMQ